MTQSNEKKQILDALNIKKELLFSILEIAKQQSSLIKNDDAQVLLEKIEIRKTLIEKLIAIEKILVETGLKKHVEYSSDEAEMLHGELKSIHKEIATLDEVNCSQAESKVEEYKQQIREIKGDKNRITSYKNINDNADGIYFDKKK